ncbi:MAG: formate dehydrogenase accessory protein FdhE [Acidobacteria bacterium]|nr:formate dehydrogenase accessory protein FdhE [Acidobacteriota bacterium]
MTDADDRPVRPGRPDTPETTELRSLRERQPQLADAIDMHIDLLALQRRVQVRIPLPSFDLDAAIMGRHQKEARALLRFEQIPLEPTDLRLVLRQTMEIMRRFDALESADYESIETLDRDAGLVAVVEDWYLAAAERHVVPEHRSRAGSLDAPGQDDGARDQVLTLALRPFLSRCAEILQPRAELAIWSHPHCPLCGGEPDFAVITPAAERHLICGRCTLRWKFDPLTCPYCHNDDRSLISSFATSDGQYRVYACNVCKRYLKAYDGRQSTRPVMPMVDSVATLPLDAAAMQRGYRG